MKKILSILLAIAMLTVFALPAMAEENATEPVLFADANDMTYYEGGYGAIPGKYSCEIMGDKESQWFERYDIAFGDDFVDQWPTEAGEHTVNFQKKVTVENVEYTFDVSMKVTVLELPALSGKCGETMNWSFDKESQTLTISGTGDMYTVAKTNEDFWNGNYGYEPGWWKLPVKHIVIEEGVESLSNYAFFQEWNGYYRIHETLQLPTTLKNIPQQGLLASTVIESLVIPEGVTALTGWPFGSPGNSFCSMTELYLPSTLTEADMLTVCFAGIDLEAFPSLSLKTIHFAGTQEQWDAIKWVQSDVYAELLDDVDMANSWYDEWSGAMKDSFDAIEVVFGPKDIESEDIVIENGTATVPDSIVEITEGKDVVIDVIPTVPEENPGVEMQPVAKVESVVISSATVDKIANAEVAVEVKLPDAAVSFDKDAIGSVSQQAGDADVTIVAKKVKKEALTTEQTVALKDKEVLTILSLEAHAGTAKITEFGGGKVTVTVPFELPEGKAGADYCVAYIANDGTITVMPTTYTEGKLSFETTHFSNYVVLEKASVDTSMGDNPPTGDNSHLLLFGVLLVVSVAGIALCTTKRKNF